MGFAIAVGSALALALGHGWTRDLDRLARAADQVRRGQPVRSGVDRPDELGRMARDFDARLDALERRQLLALCDTKRSMLVVINGSKALQAAIRHWFVIDTASIRVNP